MSKVKQKLLDIDLDIVEESNGHQLIREGEQTFGGVKTFNASPHSLMSKAEAENTAVTKAMLKNATRCVNEIFEETLTVTATDIENGYILLSKEIPTGKESSLDASIVGAGPLVCGVDYGAETDRLVLTGYELGLVVTVGDEIKVRYMICASEVVTLDGIRYIVYSPKLGRFVAVCDNGMFWSDDGREWTKGADLTCEEYEKFDLYWVVELGRFVAFKDVYDDSSHGINTIVYSDDGKEWQTTSSGAELLRGSGLSRVKVSEDGAEGYYFISQNGISWMTVSTYPEETYDSEGDFCEVHFLFWDKKDQRFVCNMLHLSHHSGSWSKQNLYTSEDGENWTYIGTPDVNTEQYAVGYMDEVSGHKFLKLHFQEEYIEGPNKGEYWIAVPASGIKKWRMYKLTSHNAEEYSEKDIGIDMYLSGLNIFLGQYEYKRAISPNGVHWWSVPSLTLKSGLCWAENKDMMLMYEGNEIEVHENFSSDIMRTQKTRITDGSYMGILEFVDDSSGDTPGDTPGGGGTGGYGDDDEPMDIEFDDHGWWFPDMPSFPGRS